VSSRGAKKIPSLCSEQAEQSHTVNVIASDRRERGNLNLFMRLPRCARNGGLPRPFRARNDIVKTYIAFILVYRISMYLLYRM
jgi:hypothetical protein